MSDSALKYCYKYPHPALTVDCVIFGFDGLTLKVLLIERGIEPFKGMWALPGGFVNINETVEEAARRELREETGVTDVYLEQFKVFSRVDRDPRERVVTVAFLALVRPTDYQLMAGDDAANAMWFGSEALPPMAFDHADIIRDARKRLVELLKLRPIAFKLLDEVFTMGVLQRLYEVINDTTYDRRNFQRKAMQANIIEPVETDDDCDVMLEKNCMSRSIDMPFCDNRGRPSRKFFKLSKSPKKKSDQTDYDGSIKDILDF